MKKIIYIFGVVLLSVIAILNFIFTTRLNTSEEAITGPNSFIYILGLIVVVLLIFFGTRFLNKYLYKDCSEKKSELRKFLFWGGFSLYIILNVIWLLNVNPKVGADSVHVANLAQAMYEGNVEEVLTSNTYLGMPLREYMQTYPQQIPLAFFYSLFFRIIHFDIMEFLRILNLIGNILIVFAMYKINNQISKKYETNKVLLFTMLFTFVSLPLLSTFVYGDILGIAFGLLAVYFVMKYIDTKKIRYAIFSGLAMAVAYMVRMNSLIFIIAIIMYLLMNLFQDFTTKTVKSKMIEIVVVGVYIFIAFLPSTIIKNYYSDKWELDKNKSCPYVSYLLMSMEESYRANGWYNEQISEPAIRNPDMAKEEYLGKIKVRAGYLLRNPGYAFNFYVMKTASMWTENTYASIFYNVDGRTYSIMDYVRGVNSLVTNEEFDPFPVESLAEPINFYQKALIILSCGCCLLFLLQNRKNVSLEVLVLITIFIGGFMFHTLWEGKSRYIIPYVVAIMPVAAISIKDVILRDKKTVESKCE